jgi:hypothetical protein
MGTPSVADVLAASRGGDYTKAAQLDGRVLVWSGPIEHRKGTNGDYIVVTAVDPESGDEFQVSNGGVLAEAIKGLDAAGLLPQTLRVVSFDSKFPGQKGYALEEV